MECLTVQQVTNNVMQMMRSARKSPAPQLEEAHLATAALPEPVLPEPICPPPQITQAPLSLLAAGQDQVVQILKTSFSLMYASYRIPTKGLSNINLLFRGF